VGADFEFQKEQKQIFFMNKRGFKKERFGPLPFYLKRFPAESGTVSNGMVRPERLQVRTLMQSAATPPSFGKQAPRDYRAQPVPRVLQSRAAGVEAVKPAANVVARAVNVPWRSKLAAQTVARGPARGMTTQPSLKQKTVQRFASGIVQATKFYPNLHPGAVESIDPSSVFRLDSFANQYRLHRLNSHSVNVPNQQYNFVRTREGQMLLHSRYRHPSIAEGKQVLYAGEIFFNNGQLEWWSNGSGHYQPFVEDAQQANLPMDQFFSYQQVIKGEHKRKKT